MKLTIDGQTYRIVFEHGFGPIFLHFSSPAAFRELGMGEEEWQKALQEQQREAGEIKRPILGVLRTRTSCIIERVTGDTLEDVAEGNTYLNPVDQYSKEFGRQKALHRAIDGLNSDLRQHRNLFVEAYHNRRNQGGAVLQPA